MHFGITKAINPNKTMKKFNFMALSCAVLLGFASCDLDDVNNEQVMNGYFTITGSYPEYKLVQDDGTIVYPKAESVYDITKAQGFGNHKRARFYVYFHENDVKTENGTTVIRNAELNNGDYLIEQKLLTEAAATEAGLLKEDSIYSINNVECWLANGYLTSIFSAYYDQSIYPIANLYAKSTSDNAVTFTLLYNRHTKNDSNLGEGTFPYSFDITNFDVPGNDSITVTFEVKDKKPSSLKVSRSDFYFHAK